MGNHPNRNKVKDWPAYLIKIRTQNNLTQKELADYLQIPLSKFVCYENGLLTPEPYLKKALSGLLTKK